MKTLAVETKGRKALRHNIGLYQISKSCSKSLDWGERSLEVEDEAAVINPSEL